MTRTAALKTTGEIVAATIEHMAKSENISMAAVVELLATGHVNTVKRFNAYMGIAANVAQG